MSGTRRARALVADVSASITAALVLADRLDEQAERIEREAGLPSGAAAGRSGDGGRAAGPDPWEADPWDVRAGGLPGPAVDAAAISLSCAPGPAGASWESPAWHVEAAAGAGAGQPGSPDAGPGEAAAPARFRPGLWRVGSVAVPALWPGGDGGDVPLAVPLLDAGNLQIDVDAARRGDGVGVVRGLLTRLLAAAPPGAVRITVYDPHGLGAGLAGLAPLRAAGVAAPTLTTRAQLEPALAELAAEVGRITVDRLAGRYGCLREREDAGLPRAEPWRVLVLLAQPTLSDDGMRALEAIAVQGPDCGVHVVAVNEPDREQTPAGAAGRRAMGELPNAVRLTGGPEGSGAPESGTGWRCSLSGPFACRLDVPPPPHVVAAVTAAVVAGAARAAARPPDARALLPGTLWGHDSAGGLAVPVAQGADGPVELAFDDDTVHGLVGGQAGAGKSTLLLDVVYGLAARYGPDQLRFHLLDFKEGLEFAQFAPRPDEAFFLPHADTVGMDSDREFGVAVLRHVRDQMQHRALAMRAVGARDLRGLRAADRGSSWPRIMVVIDEFQVMLTPTDAVSREAVSCLEVLARQGRAYGIHLLLASQTLSGIDALDSTAGKRGSIFGQFALRVALRTSISESRVLLSTANEAAGGLAGVGQAIVNRRNGHPSANELVRVAYPDPATLAALRRSIALTVARSMPQARPPRVFVGHAPAILDDNPAMRGLDGSPARVGDRDGTDGADDGAPLAFVGVPMDLSPPVAGVRLSALPGRNLAVLGPLRREAVGALQAAVVSLGAQAPAGGVRADLVAVGPGTDEPVRVCADRLRALGQAVVVHGVADLRRVLNDAADDVRIREEDALRGTAAAWTPGAGVGPAPLRLVVLFAVDAGRAGLEPRDPATRRTGLDELRHLARRGPAQRVHLLGWWRGPARLLDDLGSAHRDDVGAWLAVGVPGSDLYSLAGHRTVVGGTTPNRGVLFDRHGRAEPRTVIPFAPLVRPGGGAEPEVRR